MKKSCEICGKEFNAIKENQFACSKSCRYEKIKCIICGKFFDRHRFSKTTVCSKVCEYKRRKLLIGDDIIKECEICKKQFKIRPYKLSTAKYCSRKCKDKSQKLWVGTLNSNYGNHILAGKKRSAKICEKIRIGVEKSWQNVDRLKKYYESINSFKEKYGYYPMHSEKSKKKAYKNLLRYTEEHPESHKTYGKNGFYISLKTGIKEFYHSSYELRRMIELDESHEVKYWTKRHKIRIQYYNNKRHIYIPDFYIEYQNNKIIIEEVKGWVKDKIEFELKNECARNYCKKMGYDFIINFM